jgi:hypothetical protein
MAGTGEDGTTMKPSKQDYARAVGAPAQPATDSRPTKPLPGETAHHRAGVQPFNGPAKGPGPNPHAAARDVRRAKDAFDGTTAGSPTRADVRSDRPDQRPLGGPADRHPGEQYVRLRIRVRGDRLTVIDSHLVDGPLSQPTTFHATSAYDVTYQDRLLHAGTVPDLGLQRSFPNPEGPAGQHGHHLTPREVSEFSARIPAAEVTPETIAGIRVRLHRVEEATSAPRLTAAPLAVQFEGRITPTAELVGLPESVLPEAIDARGARTARAADGTS